MTETAQKTSSERNYWLVAAGSALLAILGTLGALLWAGFISAPQANRQAAVHDTGSQVMPFDLPDTTHIFEMTESGGVMQVIADDPGNREQVALIQQHIQHEAMLFSSGDFTDPSSLHGADMPGVKELSADADQVKIGYETLPDGAQLTFTAEELRLITAIHRWFGAQLSDHGSDATYR